MPISETRVRCIDLINKFYEENGLSPSSVGTFNIGDDKEGGFCLTYNYKTDQVDRSLIIEVYDDGDVAVIVIDNLIKTTIYNEDIIEMNFEKAIFQFIGKERL